MLEFKRAQISSWVVACASVWKSILLSPLLASGASSTSPLYFCVSLPYSRDQSTETCSRHGHCTDGRSHFQPLTINDASFLSGLCFNETVLAVSPCFSSSSREALNPTGSSRMPFERGVQSMQQRFAAHTSESKPLRAPGKTLRSKLKAENGGTMTMPGLLAKTNWDGLREGTLTPIPHSWQDFSFDER